MKLAPLLATLAVLAVASSAHGSTFCIQNENLRVCRTPVPGGVRICTTARLEGFTLHRCRIRRLRAHGATLRLSVRQAREAIHRADAYAFIGRCHRTRYSVVCRVAHEYEACEEDGVCATGKIQMADRVHWRQGHAVVSVLWTTVTV